MIGNSFLVGLGGGGEREGVECLQAGELPVFHLCENIRLLTTENHPISNHMDAYPCNLVGITTYLLSLPSPCETNLGSTNSGRGPINQLGQQTQFYYTYGINSLCFVYVCTTEQQAKTKNNIARKQNTVAKAYKIKRLVHLHKEESEHVIDKHTSSTLLPLGAAPQLVT